MALQTSYATKLTLGFGKTTNVGEVVKLYRNIFDLSIPAYGSIQRNSDGDYSLVIEYASKDCDDHDTSYIFKIYTLKKTLITGNEFIIHQAGAATNFYQVTDLANVVSRTGLFQARLKFLGRDVVGVPRRQILEIYYLMRLIRTIDISELEQHGNIETHPQLGNMSWYPYSDKRESTLCYVALKKRPKSASFLTHLPHTDTCVGGLHGVSNRAFRLKRGLHQFRKDDWGECMEGIEHTVICTLDIADNFRITTIDVENYSLGQPQWMLQGRILSVAYKEYPRLGLLYCNNRPARVVVHRYDTSLNMWQTDYEVKSDTDSFHTPRVSPSGKNFVCLSNPTFGAHKHSVKLCFADLASLASGVISRALRDGSAAPVDFFIDDLPMSCFSESGDDIIFASSDSLYTHIYRYNFSTSLLTRLEFPTNGKALLDVRHDIILAIGSDVAATPTAYVAVLNRIMDPIHWHPLESSTILPEINFEYFRVLLRGNLVSAFLVEPKLDVLLASDANRAEYIANKDKLPTVFMIHGGPHSSFLINYNPVAILYARLGLRTVFINYRGSLGVDEEYVASLCGVIGTQDVHDCIDMIEHLISIKKVDPTKIIVNGGSHGGFIVAHLTCMNKLPIRCAVMRNPVIDLNSMFMSTDIPDWCISETLGQRYFEAGYKPQLDTITKMFFASPYSKVHNANVPTLVLLGSRDRRVPMYQGKRWVDLLVAKGVHTVCKVYDDRHALEKTDSQADSTITSIIWMLTHVNRKPREIKQ